MSPANPFATAEAWRAPRQHRHRRRDVSHPAGTIRTTGAVWTVDTLVAELRDRGLRVEKRGRSWWSQCPCPAHDDRNPSLQISVGRTGGVIAKCHSGPRCTQEAVLAAIGSPAGWQAQPLALQLPDASHWCICCWHHTGLERSCADLSPDEQADLLRFVHAEQRQRIKRVRTVPEAHMTHYVLLGAVSPRSDREPWPGSDALLALPARLGRVQKTVLADLIALVNTRLAAGDDRAVPYASRWAGERLGVDPRRVREALMRLRAHGLVLKVGELPNDRWDDATPLYALAVKALCPFCAREVEARPAVVGLDAQDVVAAGDGAPPFKPDAEQAKVVGVTVAEREDVVDAGLVAAERRAGGDGDPAGLIVGDQVTERYGRGITSESGPFDDCPASASPAESTVDRRRRDWKARKLRQNS